jgi:hypothetical protein
MAYGYSPYSVGSVKHGHWYEPRLGNGGDVSAIRNGVQKPPTQAEIDQMHRSLGRAIPIRAGGFGAYDPYSDK